MQQTELVNLKDLSMEVCTEELQVTVGFKQLHSTQVKYIVQHLTLNGAQTTAIAPVKRHTI